MGLLEFLFVCVCIFFFFLGGGVGVDLNPQNVGKINGPTPFNRL